MATKFKRKSARVALHFAPCKKSNFFPANGRVFWVCELKYAIRIFKEAKSVAMTTKFRQRNAKIAHMSVLCKKWRHFCMYDPVFGNGEFKYAIRIFQGGNGVAMATKFSQK